ncbi:DNA ligase [Calidifontibacter sp. DB0510]|uniref:DNA ligase (ATP) n=1 Tax=Metallococcus carri TaxID=1656884 RepID=A0A967E8L6_9MICO|nr:DNA ligase [Metallococcus carri]NHN55352.1 DNA ligase [Metallococcus carri]NOP36429.1 DNA ligase [Calidifontibacter sp. DB2511S]
MRPMLATPASRVPTGEDWRHEVKWDGMRALLDVRDGAVRVTSRTERDVTVAFPEIVAPAAGLTMYADLLLDCEIVVMTAGRPSFGALAERFNVTGPQVAAALAASAPVTAIVFDVLRVMGREVTTRPWAQRRELLEGAGLGSRWVQVPPVFTDGVDLMEATAAQGLEGVVSKRVGSIYRPGVRSEDWRKSVHRLRDSVIVVGWRPETGGSALGALLVASPSADGLVFRGRVGSGLAGATGAALLPRLKALETDECPLREAPPREDRVGTRWVRPELVAEVEHLGRGDGGRLRQPTWQGLRTDFTPTDLGIPKEEG